MMRSDNEQQHADAELLAGYETLSHFSRKKFLAAAGGAGGAMALGGLGLFAGRAGAATTHMSRTAASGDEPWVKWVKSFEKKPIKIAVNSFLTANPFFVPSRVAVGDAGAQLGITTVWGGTPGSDTATQVAQFKALTRTGYQAIILIQGDAQAFVAPIAAAMKSGILVICANQDSPKSDRELYFGQDLYAGGLTQASLIAKFLNGKKGKVILTNCAPGSDALNKRNGGSRAGLTKAGYQVVAEIPTDATDPAKLRSQLEDAYRAHPDIVAISAGCAPDTAEAGRLKQRKGKNFVVVGHDLLFDTLKLIKSGVVNATLGQNPYLQTYIPINYAYQRVVLGAPRLHLPGGNYFTGTEPVTKDNVDVYLAREARFK
jgi:simple sugar transport system substrate-binding protein